MTIEEIEKLARTAFANGAYGPLYSGRVEQDLARFILAVLPVVKLADRLERRGIHQRQDHRWPLLRNVELLVNDIEILTALATAITTMRKELSDGRA